MPTALRPIADLFDPRGRMGRKGLLMVAILLLALQLGAGTIAAGMDLALDSPLVIALNGLFLWLTTAAASKRLHDLGKSAWLILKAAGLVVLWSVVASAILMIVLGPAALREGETGFWLSVAATTAPVLVLTLWLHCAPGMATANRFGPPPRTEDFASTPACDTLDGRRPVST